MNRIVVFLQALFLVSFWMVAEAKPSSTPCRWDSKAGAHFDLRPLTVTDSSPKQYNIKDGDIPCTPETEPTFGYSWNFCANVPSTQLPEPCKLMGKSAVVLQYAAYSADEYYCYIIGHYDPKLHELDYNFLDPKDPSKGVSITYRPGEKCSSTNGKLRTATIDVFCDNVDSVVVSAQEPTTCDYHLVMKSYYGCPTECPVTGNGLCDSHGHCAFDPKKKTSYCYCNEGYSGNACSTKGSGQESYDGYSVQLGMLIALLVVALILTGGTIYLSYEVAKFRKEQVSNHYSTLPGGESEMVQTVNFR